MKKYVIIIILLISNPASAAEHYEWNLIASSSLIITGKIDVPAGEIHKAEKTGKHRYVDLKVSNVRTLKGEYTDDEIIISYYTRKRYYAPYPESVKSLNGKDVLLFVVHALDIFTGENYFAGHTQQAIAPVDEDNVRMVREEVEHQNELLLRNLEDIFTDKDMNNTVKRIISDMLSEEKATKAYKELEDLGEEAVPYIVMNMDDRRELPVKAISLVNKSPNAFEGLRHYRPGQVVDVLSDILNQITAVSFFPTGYDSRDGVRTENVKAWKIWLLHTHPERLVPPAYR